MGEREGETKEKEAKMKERLSLKIVVIGDSGVGKSNLIGRFVREEFKAQSTATIGVELSTKTVQLGDRELLVQVWDTAGQQRYRSMASAYYRGAHGALLVYDSTRSQSFHNLEKWLSELKQYGNERLVCLLVGNKVDLKPYRAIRGTRFVFRRNSGGIRNNKSTRTATDKRS